MPESVILLTGMAPGRETCQKYVDEVVALLRPQGDRVAPPQRKGLVFGALPGGGYALAFRNVSEIGGNACGGSAEDVFLYRQQNRNVFGAG